MPIIHLILSLAVVFIWGTNFVVIKWGLAEFDPFLFAALRFALCIVPWIFFIPRPPVAWSRLAWFGVLLGAGQFGLLFLAMRADVTPGLASLVMQSQVFFTIGLSMALQGERVKGPQSLAMMLAIAGIAVIGWQSLGSGKASVTPLGLALLLCAAACWAIANLVARRAGRSTHWPSSSGAARSRCHRSCCWPCTFMAGPPWRIRSPTPAWAAGRRCCGRRWAIPCLASRCGTGCWRVSGGHGGAHGPAGAGVRHECFSMAAG